MNQIRLGVPRWLSQLSGPLLVSGGFVISGLGVLAAH